MFKHAAKLNWEGIISKRADAPYRSERTEAWLKIKAVQTGKIPRYWIREGPDGRRRSLSRQAGRQGPGLHGEGRNRLVPNRFQSNPQAARLSSEPQIKAHQTHQEAKGHMG